MTALRALVTGGTRGIGREVAAQLVRAGVAVTITARDPAAGARVGAELGCGWMQMDLAAPTTMQPVIDAEFDILINNAGLFIDAPLMDRPEGLGTSLQVMLTAPFLLIRALAPGMAARGMGRIVNVSSSMGSFAKGIPGPNGYGVSKAALNALTVVLARELAPCIRINAVDPGWVATDMGGASAPRRVEDAAAEIVALALLPEDGPTGGFFHQGQPAAW